MSKLVSLLEWMAGNGEKNQYRVLEFDAEKCIGGGGGRKLRRRRGVTRTKGFVFGREKREREVKSGEEKKRNGRVRHIEKVETTTGGKGTQIELRANGSSSQVCQ